MELDKVGETEEEEEEGVTEVVQGYRVVPVGRGDHKDQDNLVCLDNQGVLVHQEVLLCLVVQEDREDQEDLEIPDNLAFQGIPEALEAPEIRFCLVGQAGLEDRGVQEARVVQRVLRIL